MDNEYAHPFNGGEMTPHVMTTYDSDYGSQSNASYAQQGSIGNEPYTEIGYEAPRQTVKSGVNDPQIHAPHVPSPRYFVLDKDSLNQTAPDKWGGTLSYDIAWYM